MGNEIIENLGPLAALAGTWEGDKGVDISRIKSKETETKYRERIIFEPSAPVNNGPQKLYGLHYSMISRRLGEDDVFRGSGVLVIGWGSKTGVTLLYGAPRRYWLMQMEIQKIAVKVFI